MRFMDLGPAELLLIVVALVLVFGAGKLGEIGGALGKSMREFKRASSPEEGQVTAAIQEQAPVAPTLPAAASPARDALESRVSDYRPG
jgi:sec-independent protein translocase protein TatA